MRIEQTNCCRRLPLAMLIVLLVVVSAARAAMAASYEVAVYYWPNWHVDARNEKWLGKGWTEWELVKTATPRFHGHFQPRVPLWGYQDESDPSVMAKKIDAAADNGITAFIFDWYYYNEGIALDRCLHEGFLKASNRNRLKFSIMWANHDYEDIFPARIGKQRTHWNAGAITRAAFVKATDLLIKEYFSQPNYWKIDGRPYFSIYQLNTLMRGLGGAEKTRQALEDFRARCKVAGLPGVHINAVASGVQLDGIGSKPVQDSSGKGKPPVVIKDAVGLLTAIGIDSVTSYVWVDHFIPPSFPTFPYEKMGDAAVAHWPEFQKKFKVPYYPNVSVGWDSTPRTDLSQEFKNAGYPHIAVAVDGTPAGFKKYLEKAKAYLAVRPEGQRIVTINSWNEWTEGSYLEPDTKTKMEYLDAVKAVFPPQ
ncbi:MAG: glycoside hydrolase family 99-like domain-containing protein [Planctomycetota bacterium]